jgi:hypothetical protein
MATDIRQTNTDIQKIKEYLRTFDFQSLFFEELGWNRLRDSSITEPHKDQIYTFVPLAEKERVKVYTCVPDSGNIPDDKTIKQLHRLVEPYAKKHLIIFYNSLKEIQVWLWVKKELDRPAAPRINKLHKNQSGELLAQKISHLTIGIEEEFSLSHTCP